MNPVVMNDVVKRYRSTRALDGVTLAVEPGTVCALVGANGAGKSTAIKCLLGLVDPDSGSCEVLGRDSKTDGEVIRRAVGYVPERPALYEWMTVAEIGWFAAGFYAKHYLDEYNRLAREFDLRPGTKIKDLSKGMRGKVSLALALAHQPELLILDEPTSGLDPVVRREFLERIVELAAGGKTVLISSHQIAEVERVADRIVVLSAGKKMLDESLDAIKKSVRELTIATVNGPPKDLAIPNAISRRYAERQLRVYVRDWSDSQMDALKSHTEVRGVDLRVPSLEETLLAFLGKEVQS